MKVLPFGRTGNLKALVTTKDVQKANQPKTESTVSMNKGILRITVSLVPILHTTLATYPSCLLTVVKQTEE